MLKCTIYFFLPLPPSSDEIEVVKFLFTMFVCVHAENIVNVLHLIFTVCRV